MIKPLLILALALTGCQTILYGPTGKPVARIGSNVASITITMDGATFTLTGIDNSTPAQIAWHGLGTTLASAGAAAIGFVTASSGASTVVRAAASIPATATAFRPMPAATQMH